MGSNPPNWFVMESFWHAKWAGMTWMKIRCMNCEREVEGFLSDVPRIWLYERMQEFEKRCRCKHCKHLGGQVYVKRYDNDEWRRAGTLISR